jgi:hypothetical protein
MNKTATPTQNSRPVMARFLFWLSRFLPCRIIDGDDGPYLERYFLASFCGWNFYLHRFVADDPDRGLHDHPWRLAFSLVLSGFYYEETRMGENKVRWFNWLTGDSFHRVLLPRHPHNPYNRVQCWSLFCHGPTVKRWGFLRDLFTGKPGDTIREGTAIFEPYTYQREGKQDRWWKTARKGRNAPGRAPQ